MTEEEMEETENFVRGYIIRLHDVETLRRIRHAVDWRLDDLHKTRMDEKKDRRMFSGKPGDKDCFGHYDDGNDECERCERGDACFKEGTI